MKIIKNTEIPHLKLDDDQTLWAYCALDCALTSELWHKIDSKLDDVTRKTYEFEIASIGPALSMMLRGLKVDEEVVRKIRAPLKDHRLKLQRSLNLFSNAVWEKDLNPASPKQLQDLLYVHLGLPKVIASVKGKQKVSTDKEALEHLAEHYPRAKPFCNTILALRNIDKQINVLDTTRDDDGRIRCSYQVAGTKTGRWSSKESPWNTGTNLQNITKDMREMFVPDDGMTMFYADLEQAESRVTAYVSGDEGYINACETSDLHTEVVKMIWPNLGWSGDPEQDRELANTPYYHQYSYRDICKKAGHGTNYGVSPHSLGRQIKIKISQATKFQLLYFGGVIQLDKVEKWHKQDKEGGFKELMDKGNIIGSGPHTQLQIPGAFPGIRTWHDQTAHKIQTTGTLTTPFGRRTQFWTRLDDASTLRLAIAYVPQSTIGDLLNLGLYRVWRELHGKGVQILGQVHDAILGQIPTEEVDTLVPEILKRMHNPLTVGKKEMIIPSDCEVGTNWKAMKKWRPRG